jgi:hypothetical protein
MKSLASYLEVFSNCGISLPYLLNLPIPFLEDLYDARLDYLQEKRKLEEEQLKNPNS